MQAESRTSLLDYAEAQPILALESDVCPHIASPGQGLQGGGHPDLISNAKVLQLPDTNPLTDKY